MVKEDIIEILNNDNYEPSDSLSRKAIDFFNPLISHEMINQMLENLKVHYKYTFLNKLSKEYQFLDTLAGLDISESTESQDEVTGETITTTTYDYNDNAKAFYIIVYGLYSGIFDIDDIFSYVNKYYLGVISDLSLLQFSKYITSDKYYDYKASQVKQYLEKYNVELLNSKKIILKPALDKAYSDYISKYRGAIATDITAKSPIQTIDLLDNTKSNGYTLFKSYLNTVKLADVSTIKNSHLKELYNKFCYTGDSESTDNKLSSARKLPEIILQRDIRGSYFTNDIENEKIITAILTGAYEFLSESEYNDAYLRFIDTLVNTIDDYNLTLQEQINDIIYNDSGESEGISQMEAEYEKMKYNSEYYSNLFASNTDNCIIKIKETKKNDSGEEYSYYVDITRMPDNLASGDYYVFPKIYSKLAKISDNIENEVWFIKKDDKWYIVKDINETTTNSAYILNQNNLTKNYTLIFKNDNKKEYTVYKAEAQKITKENIDDLLPDIYILTLNSIEEELELAKKQVDILSEGKILYSNLTPDIPVIEAFKNMIIYSGNSKYTDYQNYMFLDILDEVLGNLTNYTDSDNNAIDPLSNKIYNYKTTYFKTIKDNIPAQYGGNK